jgi:hypothetical protein
MTGRMLGRVAAGLAGCLLGASTAAAEVVTAGPAGFQVRTSAVSSLSPDALAARFGQVGRWWLSDHTYSGDAGNLRLDLGPDGCFCEVWAGGAVAHARTLMVLPGKLVRLEGAFGPLQETGAHAVWTVTFMPDGAGARIDALYTVSGAEAMKLDRFARPVDAVLAAQIASLAQPATSAPAP